MTPRELRIGEIPVPAMCLGTMYFGTRVPALQAHACLDEAFELGARFWDTANNYAFWAGGVGDESELTIGSWLAAHGPAVREQLTIATKVGARPKAGSSGLDDVEGLSRTAIRLQLEGSLSRLGTDHVDVLYAHVDDRSVAFEETIGALAELVDQGTVRAIAASNLTAERLTQALQTPGRDRYAALQQRFTYLQPARDTDLGPHVLLDGSVDGICRRHGLTCLGYSPLLSGAHDRADRPFPEGYDPQDQALGTLHGVAGECGLTPGQTVLAWMSQRPRAVIPVVGVSTPAQVESAWTAVCTELSTQQLAALDDARHG